MESIKKTNQLKSEIQKLNEEVTKCTVFYGTF